MTDTERPPRPPIVCLCGSTRFWRTFQEANIRETIAGKIVLSIANANGDDHDLFKNLPHDERESTLRMLDNLHRHKIDLADDVLIFNVDGYIGDATRAEIAYARAQGKSLRFWKPIEDETQDSAMT